MIARRLSVVASVMLTACATGTYTPPERESAPVAERTFSASYDETWAALVDYASGAFFSIANFEKSSGLMTLTFGASEPELFIDCGHIRADAAGRQFNQPYAQYLSQHHKAKLSGRTNLLARSESDGRTTVRVNSRYVFTAPATPATTEQIFAFDSGTKAQLVVQNALAGTGPTRTCASNGRAESAVLDGVEKSLAARRR
jgi:hypothetical protein